MSQSDYPGLKHQYSWRGIEQYPPEWYLRVYVAKRSALDSVPNRSGGKDLMQRELDWLQYGNCDISDWEGRLNTNNTTELT